MRPQNNESVEVAPEEDLLGPDPTLDMWKVTDPWLIWLHEQNTLASQWDNFTRLNFPMPRISRNLFCFLRQLRQAKIKSVVTVFCRNSQIWAVSWTKPSDFATTFYDLSCFLSHMKGTRYKHFSFKFKFWVCLPVFLLNLACQGGLGKPSA